MHTVHPRRALGDSGGNHFRCDGRCPDILAFCQLGEHLLGDVLGQRLCRRKIVANLFLHFPQRCHKRVLYHRLVGLIYRDFLPVDSSGRLHSSVCFIAPAQHSAKGSKHLVLRGKTSGQRIVKVLFDHVGNFCKTRAFQQLVNDFSIDFSGVQIPCRLHRQAQFFNIKICPVGRVDFKHFRNAEQMFCADLIGLAADKPADGALGAADAGRQLGLGNFMFLHKLLHPLPDIAGQIGSLHVTHLFPENPFYPLYLIKPAWANAFL